MPLPFFEAPRLKLRRARYHIGDLTEQIRAYLLRSPFHLQIVADPTFAGGRKWVARVSEEVPPDFSAIIGDVIHNLRAALDLLACELVRANCPDDEGVHFPFAESASELDRMIERRHIDRAKPAVVALIKKLAPYKGGNAALRAIHDLDIMDKHQALIPTSDMIIAPDLPAAPKVTQPPRIGPIRDGAAFAVPAAHSYLPVGFWAQGDFSLRFDPIHYTVSGLKAGPLGGGEVVPTLIGLAKLVESIIENLAQIA
jgi:hypothetical protein